jgi:hypothetical protein
MKKTFTFLLALILVFCILDLPAQNREIMRSVVPIQTHNPTLYATDVYLYNDFTQDQRNATVAVAFNGWLFAAYSYWDPGTSSSYWQIMRSVDDGATWSYFQGSSLSGGTYQTLDIEVTGTSVPTLVVYLARVYSDASLSYLRVSEYQGSTGTFITNLVAETISVPDHYNDVSIATDYKWPAAGSSPFSVAIAYTLTTSSIDYIGFEVSGDGGNTITDNYYVSSTIAYTRGVSLSYGKCVFNSNGRYFVAWEETAFAAATGHIFVAHTGTYFNDPFTAPFQLDNIAGSSDNLGFDPVMCTQFNETDNDVARFTAIVLFDRDFGGTGTDYDVIGMYNKDPVNTDTWIRFDIANSIDMDFESDINFDPVFNNFLVTWCALTEQNLKYVVQDQNLPNPDSWLLINGGYNDQANLMNPWPKVEINPALQQVAHVWVGERPGFVGAAMFDAEYSTVGIPPAGQNAGSLDLTVYPNPCNAKATISFSLKGASHVTVDILNSYGQKVSTIMDETLSSGTHSVPFDVSTLPAGCYYYSFTADMAKASGKIIVQH